MRAILIASGSTVDDHGDGLRWDTQRFGHKPQRGTGIQEPEQVCRRHQQDALGRPEERGSDRRRDAAEGLAGIDEDDVESLVQRGNRPGDAFRLQALLRLWALDSGENGEARAILELVEKMLRSISWSDREPRHTTAWIKVEVGANRTTSEVTIDQQDAPTPCPKRRSETDGKRVVPGAPFPLTNAMTSPSPR